MIRAISLLPAATEIVASLGEERALVGITHECDWPSTVRGLPRVTRSGIDGGAPPGTVDRAVHELAMQGVPVFELDIELIRELAPDVIVTQALCDVCAVSETDVRAIAASLSPPPCVVTLSGNTLEGVFRDIASVASALGVPNEGARHVEQLRSRVSAVRSAISGAAHPRVAVIEWTDPLFTAGHWTPELIEHAGGVDVIARAGEHSRRMEIDELRRTDPEIVIVAPCGYDVARAAKEGERLLSSAGWEWTRDRQVWAVDANALVSRPGPRLVDGIEAFAELLHPDLFASHSTSRPACSLRIH